MALKHKPGVVADELNIHTAFACGVATRWLLERGFDCVITSLDDSTHGAKSKHYAKNNASGQCEAVDLRTRHLSSVVRDLFHRAMQDTLEPQGYDVILESPGEPNEHLHVEYDPKGREAFAEIAP